MLGSNQFFDCLETVVKYYKAVWILVVIQALNNITACRLFHIYCKRLSNAYHYQNISKLVKLLKREDKKNMAKIDTPIFSIIKIYIEPKRFLENSAFTVKFILEKRLYKTCKGLNESDNQEIEETIAIMKSDKNNIKNYQKKNKRMKKEKIY